MSLSRNLSVSSILLLHGLKGLGVGRAPVSKRIMENAMTSPTFPVSILISVKRRMCRGTAFVGLALKIPDRSAKDQRLPLLAISIVNCKRGRSRPPDAFRAGMR